MSVCPSVCANSCSVSIVLIEKHCNPLFLTKVAYHPRVCQDLDQGYLGKVKVKVTDRNSLKFDFGLHLFSWRNIGSFPQTNIAYDMGVCHYLDPSPLGKVKGRKSANCVSGLSLFNGEALEVLSLHKHCICHESVL